MPAPGQPKIYHITHVDNLANVIGAGGLRSDARMIADRAAVTAIGMSTIKQRRLTLPVRCHPGTTVGDYVPFYFCSRSVMLYLLYRANHPEVAYQGGQDPIVHLEADLGAVVDWANAEHRQWAFSLSNAGGVYAEFRADLAHLDDISWDAVQAQQWSGMQDRKQAEFLVFDQLPWALVSRVGVRTMPMKLRVDEILAGQAQRPRVDIQPDWYY
ncbi:MAG: DUF4433 domain-containing protein [Brevundimonas sp.]|nr:DUF4433 domain-containing protein [Brevundimonas sp.]